MLDEIAEASGVKVSDNRYIIVGCEKVPGFEAVALGAKVNTQKVQPGIVELAKKTIAEHPRASLRTLYVHRLLTIVYFTTRTCHGVRTPCG